MPRGYLKRQARAVGRKKARGGHGRKCIFHRTPAWLRAERDWGLRKTRYPSLMYEDDGEARIDWWQEDLTHDCQLERDIMFMDVLAEGEEWETRAESEYDCLHKDPSLAAEEIPSEDHTPKADSVGSGSSLELVDDDAFSCCVEEARSAAGSSFVLCDESNASASFCIIGTPDEDDGTIASASTLWEFVADALDESTTSGGQRTTLFPVSCDASIRSITPDATSVVSRLTQPATTFAPLTQCAVCLEDELARAATFAPLTHQCAICLEDKPKLVRLMQRCHHPHACLDCLQTHYLDHQMHATHNFPLQCFWPGCGRAVRNAQIVRIAKSSNDLELYYQQVSFARSIRREKRRLQLEQAQYAYLQERRVLNFKAHQICKECKPETTQAVFPGLEDTFVCKRCSLEQPINVISKQEVKAIVDLEGDNLVSCPACEIMIIKYGGCNHMTCICGYEFSFAEALKEMRRRRITTEEEKKRSVRFQVDRFP